MHGKGTIDYGFGPDCGRAVSRSSFEQKLNGDGIRGHQTRFWNGCIQTWVNVGGRDDMQFYDRDTLAPLQS